MPAVGAGELRWSAVVERRGGCAVRELARFRGGGGGGSAGGRGFGGGVVWVWSCEGRRNYFSMGQNIRQAARFFSSLARAY
mgnify:CR=1 FL=1